MQSSSIVKRLSSLPPTYGLPVLIVGMALAVSGLLLLLPFKALLAFLAYLLSVSFFLLAVTRFKLAVLIAIFLAPIIPAAAGLRLADSLPLITGQRAILLSLYLAFAFRAMVNKAKLPRLSPLIGLVLAVYIGSSIVSSLFSTLPLHSFYRILANLFDSVGLFIIVASAAANQRDYLFARKALLTLWSSFTVLALLGLIDVVIGINLLSYLLRAQGVTVAPVYRFGILRAQGLLPNSTALGVVAAFGIPLTMLILMWHRKALQRKILWICGLVLVAALVATLTRTAWLVALVGMAIWLYFTKQNRLQIIVVILVVGAILVIVGIGSTVYSLVIAGTDFSQQTEVATMFSRVRWIEIVWTRIRTNEIRLLFGFGPGSVEYLTQQWGEAGFRAEMTSDYLIRLAEGGLLGLLSFVGVLFISIQQSRRLIRSSDPVAHAMGVFFIIVFLQMGLGSATLPIFVWAQTTYLFWILWGILVMIRIPQRMRKPEMFPIPPAAPVNS